MNYPTLATATGMTLLGLSGAFADTANNTSKSNTAARSNQKVQPQQNQPRQNRVQQEQGQAKEGQAKGVQTKANRIILDRDRLLVDRTQAQRSKSENGVDAEPQPANINSEEGREDRATDAPLRVTGQTDEDKKSPQKFILRDSRGNRLEDDGQANADANDKQADNKTASNGKENVPQTSEESQLQINKKDVFSEKGRSETATYFAKQKGQKYNLPPSLAEQYRGEEIPEAWKNRSIQRGYQISKEHQPLLLAAPTDLVKLLDDTSKKYDYHIAGSNLIVVDKNYEVIDVIYLPTVGV